MDRNRTHRLGAGLALLAWLAVLGTAIVALHQAGGGPPLGAPGRWAAWASARTGVDAAFAVLRMLALALAWYLLVSTALALAAQVLGAARAVAALDPFTLGPVAALVRGAVGLGLVGAATTVTAPSATAGSTPVHHVAHQQPVEPAPSPPPTIRRLPDADEAPVPPSPPPAPAPDPAPTASDPGATTWVIAPGDHLWSVASRVLARAWSAPEASDEQVVPYWRALIAANRAVLADPANPDLVFPGQVLRLPPPGPPT